LNIQICHTTYRDNSGRIEACRESVKSGRCARCVGIGTGNIKVCGENLKRQKRQGRNNTKKKDESFHTILAFMPE